MRISPIMSYNFQHHPQKNNKKNIVFKGEYSDWIEEIAYKCQYVREPSDLILDELKKHFNSWDISSFMISDVRKRIEELHLERQTRDAKLNNMNTILNKKDLEIKTETMTHNRLSKEITEAQQRNAVEKIKMSRIVASFERVSQVKKQLENKYINLLMFDGDKKFPNAIMISGLKNDDEKKQVLDFLNKNNCIMLKTDFNKIPLNKVTKEINSFSSKIKQSGQHSILYIDNFDKYTVPTEENMDFISKLKGFLCNCSQRCNTTVLVFENNPTRLDENIIGGHRFEKKIDVSQIKEDISSVFIPKFDGYTFVYDTEDDMRVDLYLGDAGKNSDLLWVDTKSYNKVKAVLERMNEIKAQDKFKYIKYLQIPFSQEALNAGFSVCPYKKTYEGNTILECVI